MKRATTFTATEGAIITVDCLEWRDPYRCRWRFPHNWEFDNPCVVLRPIYREFETTHAEGAIEHVLLKLVCDGTVEVKYDGPHRWNEKTLRHRFAEVLAGKEFPERRYSATRQTVRIIRDSNGLTWDELPHARAEKE